MNNKSKNLNLKMKNINYQNKSKSDNKNYKNLKLKDAKNYKLRKFYLINDQRNKRHNTVLKLKKVMIS